MKNGNENPGKDSAQNAATTSGVNPAPLRIDEGAYDISDMGDAPLLAVLEDADRETESDDAGTDTADSGDSETLAPNEGALTTAKQKADASESSKDPDTPKDVDDSDKDDKDPDPSDKAPSQESGLALAKRLLGLATALMVGDETPDDLLPLMEAARAREEIDRLHAEIEEARRQGEIAGRNSLIEERLVVPPVGVPDLNGTPARSSAPASIFDLARDAR